MIPVRLLRSIGRSMSSTPPSPAPGWPSGQRSPRSASPSYVRTLRVLGNWLAAEASLMRPHSAVSVYAALASM